MGVDTEVSLPGNVRVDDVLTVLAILLGEPKRRQTFGVARPQDWSVKVSNARIKVYPGIPQMVRFEIGIDWAGNFHYEPSSPNVGRRLITSNISASNVALFMKLASFFGGWVDFDDSDKEAQDYVVPDKPDEENHPERDPLWQPFQEKMFSVEKIRSADVKVAKALLEACWERRKMGVDHGG